MGNIFNRTGGLKPGRSVFDLSYSKLFDGVVGKLYPVMCDEVVPGDIFDIGNESVVRLQPLNAPVLHEINIYVHYFFVPNRILWEDWEKYITGDVDGEDETILPRWTPGGVPAKGNLWDYMGFPLVNVTGSDAPMVLPLWAYYEVWNKFYRDENLQAEIDIHTLGTADHPVKTRSWRKDYFTSALEFQQRGIAPAFPVSGLTSAEWPSSDFDTLGPLDPLSFTTAGVSKIAKLSSANSKASAEAFFADNVVDLSGATTFDVAQLRLNIQIQKVLERNARAGARLTEWLQEHFGVHPEDQRLQRPEYIGGSKSPIIISEVLKTSQNFDAGGSQIGSPQGRMAGHGLSASMQNVCKYHAKEHGWILGIMSIMPAPMYASQGFDRQFLRRSRYDFYLPEFAHLSEQAIEREEIFATGVLNDNRALWGFQGRYDEMRIKRSGVAGNMRDTLDYWHMARKFATAPALNEDFILCKGNADENVRIFAAEGEPGFLIHFGNRIRASRPMPMMSEPGLMDHF